MICPTRVESESSIASTSGKTAGGGKSASQRIAANSSRGGGCFLGDTLVYTENGYKKIKDIKAGDIIEEYQKYGFHNMKIEQSVLNEIKEGQVPNRYLRVFLEETKYLPRDWQPDGGDDIIDDHVYDIIAKVSWQKEDMKSHYIIWEREKYKLFDKERNRKILDELIVTE